MLRRRLAVLLWILPSFAFAQFNDAEQFSRTFELGQTLIYSFRPEEALKEFNDAFTIAARMKKRIRMGRSLLGAAQAQWYLGRNTNAIDTIKQGLQYLGDPGNDKNLLNEKLFGLRVLSNIYDANGDYENAFITTTEALSYYKKGGDQQNHLLTLVQMGNLYRNVGEYPAAGRYYEEAEKLGPQPREYSYRELYHQKGRLYTERGLFDSALICYTRALPGHPNPKAIYVRIAENYWRQNKPEKARKYFMLIFRKTKFLEDSQIFTPALIGLGKIYLKWGQTDSALKVSLRAFELASLKRARQNKRDASLLLSEIYSNLGDSGRAFYYYREYVVLKDSVLSSQFKGHVYAFTRKAEEAEHASQVKLLRWTVIGLIVLGGLSLFILLLRTNNEKLKMRQRAGELEMQALRAQMNPHFIFNCLSAINHFILKNETEKASSYLTRFSRLIRLVLVNSGKSTISLEEELDMLKLYLDMEQLRFTNAFDYFIAYDDNVKPAMIEVPSFILQPFCENAIWHGLLHKDGKGKLDIRFQLDKNSLVCTITDNGIGREKAAVLKSGSKEKTGSFGHKLTTERIVLFNKGVRNIESFSIDDLVDKNGEAAGTRVTIRIHNKIKND